MWRRLRRRGGIAVQTGTGVHTGTELYDAAVDHRVFSYGTLRQADVQQALYGRPVPTVADRLPGFRLDWLTITDPAVTYVVLAIAFVVEGATWGVALREFRKAKGEAGYLEAAIQSKDPPSYIVLFEDSAALIGIVIAFVGIFAAHYFEMPVLDGVASLGISLLLGLTAMVLARESKDLLIGEPASRAVRDSLLQAARAIPGIERANLIFTVHLAPRQIVCALSLEFADKLTVPEIEEKVLALETAIRAAQPDVVAVFINPQTAGTFQSRRRMLASA